MRASHPTGEKKVPVICFCAHETRPPTVKRVEVKPLLHKNFAGEDIILPDDPEQIISVRNIRIYSKKSDRILLPLQEKPFWVRMIRPGVAIIMELAAWLMQIPK